MNLQNQIPQVPLLTYRQSVLNPTTKKPKPITSDTTQTIPHKKASSPAKLHLPKHTSPMEENSSNENNEHTTQKEKRIWEELLAPPELNPEQRILQGNLVPPGFDAFFSQLSTQKSLGRKTTLSDFPIIPTVFNSINFSIGTYNSIVSTGSVFPTALLPLAPPHAPSVQWIHQNEGAKNWLSCQPPYLS